MSSLSFVPCSAQPAAFSRQYRVIVETQAEKSNPFPAVFADIVSAPTPSRGTPRNSALAWEGPPRSMKQDIEQDHHAHAQGGECPARHEHGVNHPRRVLLRRWHG